MDKIAIPHGAVVFVGDGRKALFLRNAGDEKFPNLTTERVFNDENPPTRVQGTDRPGRAFRRAGANRRSSVETTDWHELGDGRAPWSRSASVASLIVSLLPWTNTCARAT